MNESEDIDVILNGIVDQLASIEHVRWSHWQRYMHSKGVKQTDGSLVLSADLVQRWDRQASTAYENLSEEERQSDREQVVRYLPVISAALKANLKS